MVPHLWRGGAVTHFLSDRQCGDAKPAPPIPPPRARWIMASRKCDTTPTASALCHHGQEPEDSSPAQHHYGRT